MSKIDINHLARLAKISVSADESQKLRPELEKILAIMENLQKIPTDHVEPLVSVLEAISEVPAVLVLHPDTPVDTKVEEVMKNAPNKHEAQEDQFFVVPKVLDHLP